MVGETSITASALIVFLSVFLAELGDKTQVATLLFAGNGDMPNMVVFLSAAGALVASTALAVLAGTFAQTYLAVIPLKLIAGLGFLAIGVYTLWEHFSASA